MLDSFQCHMVSCVKTYLTYTQESCFKRTIFNKYMITLYITACLGVYTLPGGRQPCEFSSKKPETQVTETYASTR